MRSQWRRLAIAALLSCACFAATLFWYASTGKSQDSNGEIPLAQVSQVGEEVLRRPATRLLWQQVNTGDNLYAGETIRTSPVGELRIQFEDGRYIDLEPDSLIVLQKSQGEISLDLMEGSLFVNAKSEGQNANGAASSGLVLNSKNGKVDLSGASASLSKGSGDRLDLQVLEGKAKLQGADGQASEIGTGRASSLGGGASSGLTILAPLPGKPTFVDTDEAKPVRFRWEGLPPAWTVTIQAGSSRKDLKDIATSDQPGQTELKAKLALGKHWWRLVAKDPATGQIAAEGPLQRVQILALSAPNTIAPSPDADVILERTPGNVVFRWQKPELGVRYQLEVASDSKFTSRIANLTFEKEDTYTQKNLNDGVYHWRMNAYYEGRDNPVVGKVQKFTLRKLDPNREPIKLQWTVSPDRLSQIFIEKPTVELSWQAPPTRQSEIARYRVRLRDPSNSSDEPVKVDSVEGKVKTEVPKAGRYIASVEALGPNGDVVGSSDPTTVDVKESPRLASPIIQAPEGILKSGGDGHLNLAWNGIQGAQGYWVTLLTRDGKEVSRQKFDETTAALKNLMPGEYNVRLEAIDEHGRASRDPSDRQLMVPNKSNIKAPTLKRIKVN